MITDKEIFFQKTFAEFFAGIGLMRMGLEQAGWRVQFANDIDATKEKLYKANFRDKDNHFYLGDIHALSAKTIPSVNLATASFPCTDLSLAGRREGLQGRQSSAFWGFVRILTEMEQRRPPLVLLENVEGFLTSNKGQDFRDALLALNKLGYAVDAFIIDAARFVPQSRVRLFIVGKRLAKQGVSEKQLSFYQSDLRSAKLSKFILENSDINWDIKDLPRLPQRNIILKDVVDHTPEDSDEWWSEERVQYLLNQTFERHYKIIETAQQQPEYSFFTAFRRIRQGRSMAEIRSDGIAGCLRTPKGGSARQILIRAGKGEIKIRFVSATECARLMGADDFRITGSFNEALFGFGDAVCVPVVRWIAENYLNPLLKEINAQVIQNEYRAASLRI